MSPPAGWLPTPSCREKHRLLELLAIWDQRMLSQLVPFGVETAAGAELTAVGIIPKPEARLMLPVLWRPSIFGVDTVTSTGMAVADGVGVAAIAPPIGRPGEEFFGPGDVVVPSFRVPLSAELETRTRWDSSLISLLACCNCAMTPSKSWTCISRGLPSSSTCRSQASALKVTSLPDVIRISCRGVAGGGRPCSTVCDEGEVPEAEHAREAW